MANPETDFSAYAAPVRFPRSSDDLTSVSHCPACFVILSGRVCTNCALDLNHPNAGALAAASASTAELLAERRRLIGGMRFATVQAAEQATAAARAAEEAKLAAAYVAYEKTIADGAA